MVPSPVNGEVILLLALRAPPLPLPMAVRAGRCCAQ